MCRQKRHNMLLMLLSLVKIINSQVTSDIPVTSTSYINTAFTELEDTQTMTPTTEVYSTVTYTLSTTAAETTQVMSEQTESTGVAAGFRDATYVLLFLLILVVIAIIALLIFGYRNFKLVKKERYEALEKGTGGHVELSPLPSKDELEPGRAQENDYENHLTGPGNQQQQFYENANPNQNENPNEVYTTPDAMKKNASDNHLYTRMDRTTEQRGHEEPQDIYVNS